jgi:opacity protein-like surface antigen
MTPKLFTTLSFSALFSFAAVAAESVEPIPTVESADFDFEEEASRKKKKKKKKKSTRSNNGQSQRERNAQDRANQKQREANRAENRADQAQKDANQAQRRANQVERQENAQGRSPARNSAAKRRADAERRDEAARRAARHRNAQPARKSSHSSPAVRPHRGGHAAGVHKRPHRWHHGWQSTHRRPVRWYHGVFVYGPNVHHHNRVRRGYYKETTAVPMPRRKIDRDGAFSVGLTTGSYASGYDLGGDFSDFGMGVTARFRPVEGLGLEVAYSVHDDTFDGETERTTTMLAPSIQAFIAPWSRVSPYASVGVTFAERAYDDTWTDGHEEFTTQINDSSFGPHVGIGLEIALGQNAALNFEARAIGYLDNQQGGTIPGAVQSTFGAQWYF